MMQRKTVLFTLDSYEIGGVVSFVKQYTDVLAEENFKVIILGRKGNLENPSSFFNNCKVVVIPEELKHSLIFRLRSFFKYYYYLDKVLKRHKIETVHFSLTWSTLYSLVHPKVRRLKKIITFYGAYDLEVESYVKEDIRNNTIFKLSSLSRKYLQFMALSSSDIIVTFSQYAKKLITRHFSRSLSAKIRVIPGYIKEEEIVRKTKRKKSKKDYIILNIGRAEPRKGILLLLDAARLLARKTKNFKVFIASPVDFQNWFDYFKTYERANLFLNVHFIHKVDRTQRVFLLGLADVFVIPSLKLETFGMTIIESMSQGVPVLGTPVGSIPEILGKVDKGLISKDPSGESLARKLEWFKDLTYQRNKLLSERSIACVRKYYSRKVVGKDILNLY